MLYSESQIFFNSDILGRYPDWQPTSMETSDWVFALQKFSREIALQGLRQFYSTLAGGFKKPKLGKIIEICRAQHQRASGGVKENKEPEPLFILKCVNHRIYKTGQKVPFYPPDPKNIPQDEKIIMAMATNTIERMGGEWEIIRSWDKQEVPF